MRGSGGSPGGGTRHIDRHCTRNSDQNGRRIGYMSGAAAQDSFSPPTPLGLTLKRYCYIDMDGFFASAEQHLRPELRGHPVGVHAGVPTQQHGVFISVSRQAKAAGIKSGMRSREATRLLPSLQVLAQRPVEYIRLHHALVARIEEVAPVHAVHSVDEVSIELTPSDDPVELMHALQDAIYSSFSPALSFAAGVASSIWLAKLAAECGKGPSGERGGAVDWTCQGVLPDVLFDLELDDLPKVGAATADRLRRHGIGSVRDYYEAPSKRIRDAFGSVDGERIWFAMHGADVCWSKRTTPESMSHGRVLDPVRRSKAEPVARWLALCGWLRARNAGLRPRAVRLEGKEGDRLYILQCPLEHPGGERETLGAVSTAWRALRKRCLPERITVVLEGLSPDPWQQLDLLEGTDTFDTPLDCAIARIRKRFGVRAVQWGDTGDPTGPYTGLKISFERVPSLEEVDLFAGGG